MAKWTIPELDGYTHNEVQYNNVFICKPKMRTALAVKWTGENLDEVRLVCTAYPKKKGEYWSNEQNRMVKYQIDYNQPDSVNTDYDTENDLYVGVDDDDEMKLLPKGYYVVKTGDEVEIYSSTRFNKNFE